jgi:hypothetical protein
LPAADTEGVRRAGTQAPAVLPGSPAAGRYRRFELRVAPTWSLRDDPRELGVMLGPVSWTS